MTKVICVSDAPVWEFIKKDFLNWDFQHPVQSLEELWDGLQGGGLSKDSKVVIISDQYFSEGDSALASAVATLAPAACVMLIQYNPGVFETIKGQVDAIFAQGGGVSAPWWVVDINDPIASIQRNWEEFVGVLAGADVAGSVGGGAVEGGAGGYGVSAPRVEVAAESVDPGAVTADTEPRGIVLACTSSKGGSGKSSVALLTAGQLYHSSRLAFEAGRVPRPLNVCVVDLDIFDGQLGFRIGKTEPTALNLRTQPILTPEVVYSHLVDAEGLGIKVLLAPKRSRSAFDTPPEFYLAVIHELRKMFDVVILDTSVQYLDELISKVVFPVSDAIIFVTIQEKSSVGGMARWFAEVTMPQVDGEGNFIGGQGVSVDKIGWVLNQAVPQSGLDISTISKAAGGAPHLATIPMMGHQFVVAANNDRLEELLWNSEIGPAYFQLAQRIYGKNYELLPLVAPQPVPNDSGGRRGVREFEGGEAVGVEAGGGTDGRRGLFGRKK